MQNANNKINKTSIYGALGENMRCERNINGNTLVAHKVGDKIENFIIVNNNAVFANKDFSLFDLDVERYKISPVRGLFYYVTYGDVIKCNSELLPIG